MIGYLFTSYLKEQMAPRRLSVWLLVCLLLTAMSFGIAKGLDTNPADAYATISGMFTFRLLPLAAAIFSASVIAQEVEQRTIVYLLTRPVSRPALILTRIFAVSIVVSLVTAVCAVGVALTTYPPGHFDGGLLVRDLAAIPIGALAYTSMFTFVSLLMNRSMIVNLAIAFVWETTMPNLQGSAYKLSIGSYLQAIAERPESDAARILNFLAGTLTPHTLRTGEAWVTLLGWCLVMLFLCQFWFSRNEYIPREDAE